MSSDRPETSVVQTSSDPAPESSNTVWPIVTVKPYVPHVFDLVTPTHRARDTAKLHIPPAFLQNEAVDSSLLLGHGASFTVTRQALPPGPTETVERTDMGGWIVEKPVKAPQRPGYVVYKAARVSFHANGEPATLQDRRALQSVLTEFHVLLHPPLLAHPNIIDFLGLAWGSNHAEPLHRLPVLVVEYGDRGTLADVQLRGSPLSNAVKRDLCLGIARGLEALHHHGIVHGDVKPENILICSHKEKTIVPKLADFGFAIIESTESSEVMICGTRTWRAPESFSPIPVPKLKLTDIYSFGLVAWSIAIDGMDPFSLILSNRLQGEDRFAAIDRLKSQDQVLDTSKFEKWITKWYLSCRFNALASQFPGDSTQLLGGLQQVAAAVSTSHQLQGPVAHLLTPQSPLAQLLSSRDTVLKISQTFRQQDYFKDIESLFAHTLTKNPDDRDLVAAIQLLEGSKGVEITRITSLNLQEDDPTTGLSTVAETKPGQVSTANISWNAGKQIHQITNTSSETKHFKFAPVHPTSSALSHPEGSKAESHQGKISWSALGFKARRFSWQLTRDLEPAVQNFAVKTLLHLSDGPSRFALGAFLLNGYGVPSDAERGLECLAQAASQGHAIAQAYLYRMFMACQKDIPPEIPVLDYLKAQALIGSRLALLDLKALEPQQAKHAREVLKYGYGGVGSNWFHEDQWLQGLTQPKLMSKDFALDCLGSQKELQEVVVNIRGDRIIHAAAAVGAYGLIQELLTDVKIDANQRNAKGETALLCACRSGHPDMVKLLLDSGAQASIQAANGESPLHWLLSFDENINPAAIGKDLIERGGASVHAFTTQRISHSVFPGSIDVDFQVEGTPLMWAVHDNKPRLVLFLLSMGADPNWRFQKTGLSPLEWAAFYHHSECLEMMIDHLERTINTPMTTEGKKDLRHAVIYGPLVREAVHASDKFSMILRNGANYLSQFKSTLTLLREKTKLVRFSMGSQNETLLHFAAREAHDEACEIILESGWRIEELDQSAGPAGLTPLLESVRWNRRALFHLLRKHGADAHALALSPYDEHARTWSALHVFAEQAHNDELALVDDLLAAGVPVDGDPAHAIETPFNVAVRRNAFRLADCLLRRGASLHAARARSSLIVCPYPLTGLGHIIALNARYSFNGMRYMLGPHEAAAPESATVDFVVEPARGLSALHLCALVPHGLAYVGSSEALTRGDFDWETNRAIVHELLEWFREPGQLDLRCQMQAKTALHLAAEYGNVGVAEELVKAGADKSLRYELEETPADIARRVFAQKKILGKLLAWLE